MKYLAFVVLFFFTFFSYAQDIQCNYSVRGTIKGSDGELLVGATVIIAETTKGAISDSNGKYILENLCEKDYKLIISFIGYNNDTLLLKVDKPIERNFVLTEENLMLENIQVTADGIDNMHSGNDDLSGELLDRAQGGSLGESLEKIVGVTTLKTGPGIVKPVIHGLHSNRVLILNNGIRQEGQQWGSEHAPEIDPFIASKLTVVKGAETVRYGSDAIGGLIIVEPPDLHDTDSFGGEFNLSTMSNSRMGLASGTLEGNINFLEDWAWRVQGTIKRAGDSRSPDYNLTNTGIAESNFSAGFGYKKEKSGLDVFYSRFNTEIGILQAAHIGNLSDLQAAIAADQPTIIKDFSYAINYPKQEVIHNLLKIQNHYILPKNKKLEILYGGQGN
ncbi:MAG: carboxypeptidase-like regulatory domain-containing protein, partial [Cyclobacteriaceae bacterium]|nr:carboxypeptidase-like regulatory domain-containing protein [Cyclobacteriaceae bacterium]